MEGGDGEVGVEYDVCLLLRWGSLPLVVRRKRRAALRMGRHPGTAKARNDKSIFTSTVNNSI